VPPTRNRMRSALARNPPGTRRCPPGVDPCLPKNLPRSRPANPGGPGIPHTRVSPGKAGADLVPRGRDSGDRFAHRQFLEGSNNWVIAPDKVVYRDALSWSTRSASRLFRTKPVMRYISHLDAPTLYVSRERNLRFPESRARHNNDSIAFGWPPIFSPIDQEGPLLSTSAKTLTTRTSTSIKTVGSHSGWCASRVKVKGRKPCTG